MTEMEKNEILAAVRAALTGNTAEDMVYLQEQAETYDADPDTKEVVKDILDIAYSLLSPEQDAYMKKMLCIGDRRLDEVYGEATRLMRSGQTAKALTLTRQLYEHITENFKETPERRFFSFRNLLESNLYHILYHPTKELVKTPFDFSLFIGAHAYNLIEVRRLDEAIPVLQEAIRYNPVNPDVRFELAEIYKLKQEEDKLLETICDTLPICASAYAIARCYANLGYWCVDRKDYTSAVAFYYESLLFADHPQIAGELRHVEHLMGQPIVPPNRDMINAAFAKYEIYHGPGRELLHTARELAKQAQEGERWEEAVYYLTVVNSLIRDDEAKESLKKCRAELEKLHPAH